MRPISTLAGNYTKARTPGSHRIPGPVSEQDRPHPFRPRLTMKARASETGSLPGRNARFVFGTECLVFGVYVLSNKERWAMFEDSLVESSGRLRQRDRWSTAVSFTVQVAFIGLLVLLPLIYTEGLPKQQLVSIVEAPSPPAAPAQHLTPHPGRPSKPIDQSGNRVLAPRAIPKVIAIVHDELTG